MTDDELIAAFEDASLPETELNHRNHVRLGWLYVRGEGLLGALNAFPSALRRYAAAHGKTTLYHETITWAYLMLIHERLAGYQEDRWTAFSEANRDLFDWAPSILDRYYDRELLESPLARRTFVLPRISSDHGRRD